MRHVNVFLILPWRLGVYARPYLDRNIAKVRLQDQCRHECRLKVANSAVP